MFREIEVISRLELKYIKCTLLHAPLQHLKIALESPEALSDKECEQIVNIWTRRIAV